MTKKILVLLIFSVSVFNGNAFAGSPKINSFSPSSGSAGTLVMVIGKNLGRPESVTIGGVNALVVSATSVLLSNYGDTLVAMVMPGSSTGDVSITISKGAAKAGGTFKVISTSDAGAMPERKLVGTGAVGHVRQGGGIALSAGE